MYLCAESQLSARLDKRRSELERAEKRLATLAGVRPAYMDEYEALTGQLQVSLQPITALLLPLFG
jgi:hypothetical protein